MVLEALRNGFDILKRARSVREVLNAVVPGLAAPIVLNEGEAEDVDAATLIRRLRRSRNALKAHVLDGKVDYAALRSGDAFGELEALAPSLASVRPEDLPRHEDRLAFFIDLYNVLSIHGVLALDIEDSVMEVPSFFGRVSYRVGEAVLSLDAMENGVLRRNGGHPATGRRVLKADDAGLAFCPERVDPRIHAALVCASESCPPVGFYDPEHVDAQLDLASASYVNAAVRVTETGVRLPITFRYYAADWGQRADIERFLLAHADEPLRSSLEEAFGADAPWRYDRYDWSLNFV